MSPGKHRPTWQKPGILVAIALGGVIGACARYELALAIPTPEHTFPTATFVVNVTGSFILGMLLTLMLERWRPHELIRPFVATGIIGAYTTWSTFMTDADKLIKAGCVGIAVGYIAASLLGGLAAVSLGIITGRGHLPRFRTREE